ncbi:MAG: NADH-quinone oxidoreductase subunit B family protein [Acidimicrobiales bacterium]
MPWLTRGLRQGVVTSHYPRRPDDYGPSFRATVGVRTTAELGEAEADSIAALCPTGAISTRQGGFRIDRGRCIACGRCVGARSDIFWFDPDLETARLHRDLLIVPAREETPSQLATVQLDLARRVRGLRRSIHIRHLDCGSDGTEEWEIAALTGPIYDVQRLGIYFTASPRHADLLLVTGAGAAGMLEPLRRTFEAMPAPKVVVAIGTDAASGGMFADSYATRSGIAGKVDVDVFVPGSPPSPFSILHGILLAVGLLPAHRGASAVTEGPAS